MDGMSAHRFELTGGALCLDFANTVGDRPHRTEEHLHGYADLLEWSRQASALDARELRSLSAEARRRPREARAAFLRALELRETLYRVFRAAATGGVVSKADLAAVNKQLGEAGGRRELQRHEGGFRWRFGGAPRALDRMLWPVVRSAGELLATPERERVRECDSDRCSWLFIDRSRARTRRWCDMKSCGNRAKARRHYQRVRERR